jgi:hypothetical protein
MALFSTTYKNPSRIVSGTPQLFADDVVLLCNTSASAVVINLLEIPADYWNTTWKLYVVDNSSNAGTNNITINAPSGYTINNQSSVTINQNDGECVVRISSNTSFLAEFNYQITSSALDVLNEGVSISPTTTSMNFVGALVNATAVGNAVTVTINGINYISVTYSSLSSLISTNAVQIGQNYLISNAIFLIDANETVPIMVKGIATNGVSLEGSGIFLNADYQQIGNYSGVSGFVANIGVWTSALTPVANDVCMWRNYHYKNLTGANGVLPPDSDFTNWIILAKNVTNGYIQEIDFILYDVSTNYIKYREDKRLNKVDNNPTTYGMTDEAFFSFQWGNNEVQNNIVSGESTFGINNNLVIGNPSYLPTIFQNEIIDLSVVDIATNSGVFQYNSFKNSSSSITTNLGSIKNNNLIKSTLIIVNNGSASIVHNNTFLAESLLTVSGTALRNFKNNQLNNSQFTFVTMQGSIENLITLNAVWTITTADSINGTSVNGNSTALWTLDFNDATVWNSGTNTLTIPTGLQKIMGVYVLQNTGGASVQHIINLSTQFPTIFKGGNQNVTFRSVQVATATTNDIVSDQGNHNYNLVYRINGNDYITLIKNGTFNAVQDHIIYT